MYNKKIDRESRARDWREKIESGSGENRLDNWREDRVRNWIEKVEWEIERESRLRTRDKLKWEMGEK